MASIAEDIDLLARKIRPVQVVEASDPAVIAANMITNGEKLLGNLQQALEDVEHAVTDAASGLRGMKTAGGGLTASVDLLRPIQIALHNVIRVASAAEARVRQVLGENVEEGVRQEKENRHILGQRAADTGRLLRKGIKIERGGKGEFQSLRLQNLKSRMARLEILLRGVGSQESHIALQNLANRDTEIQPKKQNVTRQFD